jgi:hypothetical protein
MPAIVAVHGIAQQNKGPEVLAAEWGPALRDGVRQAGFSLDEATLACAFYGGHFRPIGQVRAVGDSNYRASDLTEDEGALLLLLWREAARVEPDRVASPDAAVRASTPGSVQMGLRALALLSRARGARLHRSAQAGAPVFQGSQDPRFRSRRC